MDSMTSKKILTISVLSFLVKGGCALYINYLIINYLSFSDFGVWAILFSVAVLLSVADFGAGQYVLTTFTSKKLTKNEKDIAFSNSFLLICLICVIVTIVGGCIIFFTKLDENPLIILSLYIAIVYRIVVIPYGAYLQSQGRYYEKKLFEAISYMLSLIFIILGIEYQFSLMQLLLGMNAFISLSSVIVHYRAKQLNSPIVSLEHVKRHELKLITIKSFPYFINNTSGLLIYGIFISVSSMFLEPIALAKLAILHAIIFTNLYQGFELVFRTLQTRLNESKIFKRLVILVAVGFIFWLVITNIFGKSLLFLFFPTYDFSSREIYLYSIFMFLEYFYLLYTSKIQMLHNYSSLLLKISLIKLSLFLIFSIVLTFYSPIEFTAYLISLMYFSGLLSACFIYLYIKENTQNLIRRAQ
jgi:O-antigen/teichoic acid export membrane protein